MADFAPSISELDEEGWAAGELVTSAVGFGLFDGCPGSRSPVWPVVFPVAGDSPPLCGRTVNTDETSAARNECVIGTLDALAVERCVSTPGVFGLDVEPPLGA